ncbi:hypothetical protein G9A89_003254 [Geosiphon pyriformis]|nr:hypothetical protein G9A89_003254 [Geosiphon pyriformis]
MSLIDWPSTLASVYMAVIGLVSRVIPLNNDTVVVFSSLKENMTANNSSSVLVAGGMLLISDTIDFGND